MKLEEMINKVHCADCLEFMKKIPDKSIDMVLTDPPYGIGIAKNGKVGGCTGFKQLKSIDYGNQEWDNKIPEKEYFDEIFRISRNQIIFGGNYFIEYLRNSPCWIVWDKKEFDNSNFADCELAWTSFGSSVRKFKYGWVGLDYVNNSKNDKRQHPTQKPLELMRWCLTNYSTEGQTVLDPFLGSGTTAVACQELHRNFIGIEISESYCDIARKRLAQKPLF